MDTINFEEYIRQSWTTEPKSALFFGIGLALSFLLSLGTKYVYERYSNSISDRRRLLGIIIPLTLVVFMLVSTIKSSLALSFGTLGALSIVRFRTPVKSMDDLLVIFLSVAIGITLGANQFTITIVITVLIWLIFIWQKTKTSNNYEEETFTICISTPRDEVGLSGQVEHIIRENGKTMELLRVDVSENGECEYVYNISFKNSVDSKKLIEGILRASPSIRVSLTRKGDFF